MPYTKSKNPRTGYTEYNYYFQDGLSRRGLRHMDNESFYKDFCAGGVLYSIVIIAIMTFVEFAKYHCDEHQNPNLSVKSWVLATSIMALIMVWLAILVCNDDMDYNDCRIVTHNYLAKAFILYFIVWFVVGLITMGQHNFACVKSSFAGRLIVMNYIQLILGVIVSWMSIKFNTKPIAENIVLITDDDKQLSLDYGTLENV